MSTDRERNWSVKSYAQALDLKSDPSLIEAYRRHHVAVWPEVVTGLRAIGIREMRIWLVGTRLFMLFEAPDDFDPSRDFRIYDRNPRCRRWEEWMRTFQVRLAEAGPQDWWTPMEEIFALSRCSGEIPTAAS
ncbi:MAG: L-rhamnose mutarotase [Phycisphaerae bacterium]|jgi:L-rhamnose mutarotase|nr:L-rhamnose mutarotase [Phycisphaerae bacterium]